MGVLLTSFGNLQITADLPGSNTVTLSDDAGNVKVELNGVATEFPTAKVHSITYTGGVDGGDTYTDSSAIVVTDQVTVYGGKNTVTVGVGVSSVHFHGDGNTLSTVAGSYGGVFSNGGTGNTVNGPGKFTVYP